MELFLKNYFIFLLSILVFWLIGSILKSVLKIKEPLNYASLFSSLLIGIVVFTVFTALIATKGKTIFILTFLFIPLFWYQNKFFPRKELNNLLPNNHINNKLVLIGSFIALHVIFLFRYFTIHIEKNLISLPHVDYLVYTRLSYYLLQTGIEHILTNPFLPPDGITPYHYFENWLNAGISWISQANYLENLMLVIYPMFIFLTWIGFCAILERIAVLNKYIIPIWAFLGTFFTGLYVPFLYDKFKFLQKMSIFTKNEWNYHKLSVIYVFLIASMLAFAQNKKYIGYLIFLFLPVFYGTTAPAIFGAMFLFAIFLLFVKQKKEAIWILVHTLIIAFFSGSIYLFFTSKAVIATPQIDIKEVIGDIKTKINIIGGTSIQLSILYIFVFPLLWLAKNEIGHWYKKNNFLVIIPLLILAGLGSWALFSHNTDAVQIFANIGIPAINISCILLIAKVCNNNKKMSFFWIYSCIIVLINLRNDETFVVRKNINIIQIQNIKEELKNLNKLGVSWREKKDYNTRIFSQNTNLNMLGNYLNTIFSEFFCAELNVHQIPIDSSSRYVKAEISMVTNSPFYRFVEKQKKENKFISLEQSHLNFIKEYQIDFLITYVDTQLPEHLKRLVKKELAYDNEKICILARNKIE